ncbi:sugar ABC transporter ATP-binding protein [Aggregatilinea lenta]|uniref:sugar ABC transporter ATP-binding protein n=1 Tax=Aggregatilinea lenta TaxID=913108 RepID=UPI000E5A8BAA|nr:sugar ABC transporter ATP-binding protein [Aggregatilinea lenta]
MQQSLLKMQHISKAFLGVQALDDVMLEVGRGEVHGLLGENGAGKSTLIKILSGAYKPDSGTIEFDGREVNVGSPQHAQHMGIVTIYQEFTLVPSLSIAENVLIGREPGPAGTLVNWRQMRRETREITTRLGINLDPMRLVRTLSVAEQQMVEIARALSMKSKLIIMDEPTAALSENEVVQLMDIVRELKSQGISIIFITHHLEEALNICDHVTILRDGRLVGRESIANITLNDIIRMMVGRSVEDLFKREASHEIGETALKVTGLSRTADARNPTAIVLNDISFEVHRGEILGVAGLVGAGRTEVARAIFGADSITSGTIEVSGKPVKINSPRDAIRYGLGLVPEDRKQQALFLALAVRENMSIASLPKYLRWGVFMRERAEQQMVAQYRTSLNISMSGPDQRVRNLSGGNQQKVVLARWLALSPQVLIVDEPTRGIDIAAKAEVHQLLDEMARNGIAIIMISSELPEILGMSDRIITLRNGRLTGEFMREEATEERLMQVMALEQQSIVS